MVPHPRSATNRPEKKREERPPQTGWLFDGVKFMGLFCGEDGTNARCQALDFPPLRVFSLKAVTHECCIVFNVKANEFQASCKSLDESQSSRPPKTPGSQHCHCSSHLKKSHARAPMPVPKKETPVLIIQVEPPSRGRPARANSPYLAVDSLLGRSTHQGPGGALRPGSGC